MVGRESPFIFEDAVPREKFFDRRREIDFFVSELGVKRKMLICIVAPLKYGKTSLMLRYEEILEEHPGVIPVYVNLKRVSRPIEHILVTLKKYNIDLSEEYRESQRKGELLPFFEKLDEILNNRNLWLFLLFDEFHLLPKLLRIEGFYRDFSDKLIFGFIRGLAEGARISYVVCGSMIKPLLNAVDVWGGRFQMIYLGPFSEDDAIEMIKKLFLEGGMSISKEDAKIIAEAAGYHPFYIQYVGHQIFKLGQITRATIRAAKKALYEYLFPIFADYYSRIKSLGEKYMETLSKIISNKNLDSDDISRATDLLRIGILKPENAEFKIVDPLFKRYLEQIINNYTPTEPLIVGHWAERIVGNYLLKKGFTPYYSHDSRGAFDIYVKIHGMDVGIQVRYSTKGEIYLSEEEVRRMLQSADEMKWKPILALVGKQIKFFTKIVPTKYSLEGGHTDIVEALKTINNNQNIL